jgi:Flp pilus assembly protein TadG
VVIPTTRKKTCGQGLVEFALILPIILLLLLGIVVFGQAWMTKSLLTGAAREAARIAVLQATPDKSSEKAIARANELLVLGGIKGASVTVNSYDSPEPTIEVTIAYPFPVPFGGFFGIFGKEIPLSSRTSMRRQGY